MKVLGFAGYSGSGKTTLIEQLIPRLTRQGLRVSLIKHAHHNFDIDHPGKDSYRHREAGASEVMLVSGRRWAMVHELRDEPEPSLEEQLARMSPCDLILVEGFKKSAIPKIEIHRPAHGAPRMPAEEMNIIALATDSTDVTDAASGLPQLDLNDPDEIAGFILEFLELTPQRATQRTPARRTAVQRAELAMA